MTTSSPAGTGTGARGGAGTRAGKSLRGGDLGPATPPAVLAAGVAAAAAAPSRPAPLPEPETERLPDAPKRPARRKSAAGRRAVLTTDMVVSAAIEVLDDGGVAGLSMRRVADRLGTGVASLYAHVSGKEELLELIYDALVSQIPPVTPDPAIWRDQLRDLMRQYHGVLVSHTDAALAGLGRIPTSPKAMAAAEMLAEVMQAGGLHPQVIALGLDQLALYVSAAAFEDGLFRRGMPAEELLRYYDEVHRFFAALPANLYPVLASIAPDMTGHDDVARFNFGLDVLIAGLEAVSARLTASSGTAPA